jgi:GTP pyrophosphokinase
VDWGKADHQLYPVSIRIEALNRDGLLRDISALVAEDRVDMTQVNAVVHPDHTATITATLQVTGIEQVSRIMAKIEGLRDVLDVRRDTLHARNGRRKAGSA